MGVTGRPYKKSDAKDETLLAEAYSVKDAQEPKKQTPEDTVDDINPALPIVWNIP